MTTVNARFTMTSGDTKRLNFTVTDELGAALNITGASFDFGLSKLDENALPTVLPRGSVLVSKDNGGGGGVTITDGPNGLVRVDLAAADSAPLSGLHYYELEMILSGETSTVATGQTQINKDLLV